MNKNRDRYLDTARQLFKKASKPENEGSEAVSLLERTQTNLVSAGFIAPGGGVSDEGYRKLGVTRRSFDDCMSANRTQASLKELEGADIEVLEDFAERHM